MQGRPHSRSGPQAVYSRPEPIFVKKIIGLLFFFLRHIAHFTKIATACDNSRMHTPIGLKFGTRIR